MHFVMDLNKVNTDFRSCFIFYCSEHLSLLTLPDLLPQFGGFQNWGRGPLGGPQKIDEEKCKNHFPQSFIHNRTARKLP